jgi:leucyl aminopeptidase
MKVTSSRAEPWDIEQDSLIVPVIEGESPREGVLARLDQLTGGLVTTVFNSGEIEGKAGDWVLLHTRDKLKADRVLLCGAGKTPSTLALHRLAGAAARVLAPRGARSAAMLVRQSNDPGRAARVMVEGFLLGLENPGRHSSDRSKGEFESLVMAAESKDAPDIAGAVRTGLVLADAANFARMLGNEPANIMTPSELAGRSREMAEREGLAIEVLGKDAMERAGMGALLAVARGSEEAPQFIVISYDPEPAAPPRNTDLIALIGKGITFDSGGISIKPAEKMDEMKFDMCGGAAVIGAMQAIARLRPPVRLMGVIPACENLPSGRAVKPGDVVRSLSGKTIEVLNTDAEGRLILADAITYAAGRGATHMIDAATLTGAVVVALGQIRAGVMGTDQQLIDDLIGAGDECGERLWQMPLNRDYGELVRSEIADVKNTGNRTAGAITAAMFLKSFAGTVPWAHLDIAGTAWLDKEKPYMAKGATGFGVRTFVHLVLKRGEQAAVHRAV